MQKVIVSCFCQTWGWSSHCLRGVTQTHLQSRKGNAWLDRLGSPSVTCEGEQVFLKGFWWTLVLQWWMDMRSIHTLSERLKHYTIETNDFVANVKCYCVLYTLFLSCRLGVHCDWNQTALSKNVSPAEPQSVTFAVTMLYIYLWRLRHAHFYQSTWEFSRCLAFVTVAPALSQLPWVECDQSYCHWIVVAIKMLAAVWDSKV